MELEENLCPWKINTEVIQSELVEIQESNGRYVMQACRSMDLSLMRSSTLIEFINSFQN